MLHVQFAMHRHFSGKINVFHYYQTINFTWYQALGAHSKNRFQYHVIPITLLLLQWHQKIKKFFSDISRLRNQNTEI